MSKIVSNLTAPDEAFLWYAAGIVDGEGSIGLKIDTRNNSFAGRIVTTVSNTKLQLLETFKEKFNAGSISQKPINVEDNRQPCFVWRVNSNAAYKFLKLLIDKLMLKKKQAELAIRAYEINALKDVNFEQELLAIKEELTKLNQRGAEAVNAKLGGKVSDRKCSISDCEEKHYGKGYCRKHYRWAYESKTLKQVTFSNVPCKNCGEDMSANMRADQVFCSTSCKMKWHRREGCYAKELTCELISGAS